VVHAATPASGRERLPKEEFLAFSSPSSMLIMLVKMRCSGQTAHVQPRSMAVEMTDLGLPA
jgi:hypothetical protein